MQMFLLCAHGDRICFLDKRKLCVVSKYARSNNPGYHSTKKNYPFEGANFDSDDGFGQRTQDFFFFFESSTLGPKTQKCSQIVGEKHK